ncbi:hypothetical protein BOW53_12155 [Solemya pervernicosa gill symbiont]|uniref:Uncharacterized protein n=2 Tax=Gammaproteobacteria incertae sedis TaxID=118884 RepID=A0A1T2L2X4_9GAMM|nr:hypothetical protein [Candidatus Reidiella endopervernicosa]OOZ39306.1 hypothetical protein BOW53_12155 [Solemya pervernicosa gill symbiont]QKQ25512.1 hypothetical protein HUE57_03765 [Candidatus Reidiella endopervernicosa]
MNNSNSTKFWLGNAVLAVALIMLLFMGAIWEAMGGAAMGLWIALVIAGVYLLSGKGGGGPNMPE